jgi:hypothetical protein
LWQWVSRAMWRGHDTSVDNAGGVWAYAWAAVALLLLLSAILMVEFMQHFFRPTLRPPPRGTCETIVFT